MYYIILYNEPSLHNTSITRVCRYTSPALVVASIQLEEVASPIRRDPHLLAQPPR